MGKDVPGRPMIKTPHSQCRGASLVPGWGTKEDPTHATWCGQKKKKMVSRREGGMEGVARGLGSHGLLPPPTRRLRASQVTPVVKNPAADAGDTRGAGSIPGSGKSPGGANGSPIQFS